MKKNVFFISFIAFVVFVIFLWLRSDYNEPPLNRINVKTKEANIIHKDDTLVYTPFYIKYIYNKSFIGHQDSIYIYADVIYFSEIRDNVFEIIMNFNFSKHCYFSYSGVNVENVICSVLCQKINGKIDMKVYNLGENIYKNFIRFNCRYNKPISANNQEIFDDDNYFSVWMEYKLNDLYSYGHALDMQIKSKNF